jgi:hypothetical protein
MRLLVRYDRWIPLALAAACRLQSGPPNDGKLHLTGAHVVRYRPDTSMIEGDRYILRGEVTERGCRFRSRARPGYTAEWAVEYDVDHCVQVRALGWPKHPEKIFAAPEGARVKVETAWAVRDPRTGRLQTGRGAPPPER